MYAPPHASQEWYSQEQRATTATEVLVLALLLVSHYDQDAVAKWAREVADDSTTFEVGAAWVAPKPWSKTKKHIHAAFKVFVGGVKPERRQAVAHAAHLFDGDGRTEAAIPESNVGSYISRLMQSDDSKALLGLGGGPTARKGAPLRRAYILPRVARLLIGTHEQLTSALAAGYDAVYAAARAAGSDKPVRSPPKLELKVKGEEDANVIANLGNELGRQVRATPCGARATQTNCVRARALGRRLARALAALSWRWNRWCARTPPLEGGGGHALESALLLARTKHHMSSAPLCAHATRAVCHRNVALTMPSNGPLLRART